MVFSNEYNPKPKPKLKPIGPETVVNKVIDRIMSAILTGMFKVGEKLPSEYELIEELQVSRNSLREAMKILSAMGVVNIRRGDGTYICSQINPNLFDSVVYSFIMESSTDEEILELRKALDEATLKLVIKKCTLEEINRLQEYVDGMRYYRSIGEVSKAAKLDYQFHIYLADICRNQFLARIVKGVYRLFKQSIEESKRTNKSDQHHQDIVDCLKNRDVSKIDDILTGVLSSWKETIKKSEKD